MKTNLLQVSVLAVIAAAAVHAQSSTPLIANVPFDFVVGAQTLHAGQYTVDQGMVSHSMVVIRRVDREENAATIGNSIRSAIPKNNPRLVFHRYGGTYFLSEVWGDGDYARELPKTRRERELAAQRVVPETAIVAASR